MVIYFVLPGSRMNLTALAQRNEIKFLECLFDVAHNFLDSFISSLSKQLTLARRC